MRRMKKNKRLLGIYTALCLTACMILPSGLYSQQQNLKELFAKMREARRTISYTGEIIVTAQVRGGSREYRKKVTASPGDYFEEIILSPEDKEKMRDRMRRFGRERASGRHGEERRREGRPGQGIRRGERPEQGMSGLTFTRMKLLRENYNITVTTDDPIAGRQVNRLSVIPKYDNRVTNNFWVDIETGVILKREIQSDGKGSFVTEIFDTITYHELTPEEIEEAQIKMQGRYEKRERTQRERRFAAAEYSTIDEVPDEYRNTIISPGYIPEGFIIDKVRVFTERKHTSFHQVYTDGLLLFSLFQTPGQMPKSGGRGRGGPMGSSRMLIKRDRNNNFILVGYIPRLLMQKVFESLPGEEIRRN